MKRKQRVLALAIGILLTVQNEALAQTVRLWRDASSSMDEALFHGAVDKTLVALSRASDRVDRVELVTFARGTTPIFSEPVETFVITASGAEPKFVPPPKQSLTDIFEAGYQEKLTKARGEYERQMTDSRQRRQQENARAFAALRVRLLEPPRTSAPCTRFVDLVARIAGEGTPANIVFSDLWSDCPEAPAVVTTESRILFVWVPRHSRSSDESESAALARATQAIGNVLPHAWVVPVFAVESALAKLLLGMPAR